MGFNEGFKAHVASCNSNFKVDIFLQVDFGSLLFPTTLNIPKPRVLPEIQRLAHGVRSGNVTILDAKTFYIPNLHYDGSAPDAFFYVGNGPEPNPQGIKIPNELGEYV